MTVIRPDDDESKSVQVTASGTQEAAAQWPPDAAPDAVLDGLESGVLSGPVSEPGSGASTGPVAVRSAALVVIAVLASLCAMHWARAVCVPLLLGLMFSYALKPLVNRMVGLGLPRGLAAALLLLAIVSGIGTLVSSLSDDATALIEGMPAAAQKLRRSLEGQPSLGTTGTIQTVQKAAAELERAAKDDASTSPVPGRGVTKVQIEKTGFNIKDYLWPGALGLVAVIGQATVVLFISFFLLASGDTFRRKMVRISGPGFGQKRLTLQAIEEIDLQIQRYLLVQLSTSVGVGVATWLAFWALGVEHAAVWGVASFVLNFIPYFGSIVVTVGSALMGFVQFGSFEMALAVGGAALLIHSIEGYLLTPWLINQAGRMNPVAVFVGVLFWGWLWGVWGLFLGVPILMAIKAVCDRIETLMPVGELLGH